MVMSKQGRAYYAATQAALREIGLCTIAGPVNLEITVSRPDRRKRDIDNLCKCIVDALTAAHGGPIVNDSQVECITIRWADAGPDTPTMVVEVAKAL
jgi:Holliday junction resolvase RusA-like endonuclease